MRSSVYQAPKSRDIANSKDQSSISPTLAIDRWSSVGTWNLDLGLLFACAVCGGAHSESPLAQGMNWGIFTLMGVIGTVLAGIALFFVHIVRKEEANPNPPPPDRPVKDGPVKL